jgi:hypothetical protein
MKIRRQVSGPFREQLFFEPGEIDDACVDALKQSGFLPDVAAPIDVERFVEKHFGCECGYEDLPEDIMGFTAFDKKGKVVGIRIQSKLEDGTKVGERRVRSTWAHEAGHGLLHAILFAEIPGEQNFFSCSESNVSNNRILCRPNDIKPVGSSYDGRWWEWQANRCIGGLLLPKNLAEQALENFLQKSLVTGNLRLPAAKRSSAEAHIANVFNVNPAVARIRIDEMFPQKADNQFEF